MLGISRENVQVRREAVGPKLSACLIARNNAQSIEPCLLSIRPWVGDLVVVDTGSTDDTREIARRLGARVFEFPWIDDFSAARNVSLQHALGEWIFWMDTDDTISEGNGRKLQELAHAEHAPHIGGFVMQVHCPGVDWRQTGDVTIVDHVKMFRNHPQNRFEGRIHEQVMQSIRQGGGDIAFTDIFVEHTFSDQTPAGRQRKIERDLRILALDLQDRPDHPFVLFNLGMTYNDIEQHAAAVPFLQRCVEVSHPGDSHVRKAYAYLVTSLSALGRKEEAGDAVRRGRELFPNDAELVFRHALLAQSTGQLNEAVRLYHAALHRSDDRHLSSIDPAMAGYKARHNLAVTYNELQRPDLAETQWRTIIAEQPRYRAGWRALADTLLRQGKLNTLEVELQRRNGDSRLGCESIVIRGELAMCRGDMPAAREAWSTAVQQFPTEPAAHQTWCRFLFEHGAPEETETAFRTLVALQPRDGAAWHNFGTVLLAQHKPEQAIEMFERSLEVRPDSPPTRERLQVAQQQLKPSNRTATGRNFQEPMP